MPNSSQPLAVQVTSVMDLGKECQAEQPWRVLTGGNCFEKTHGGTGPWDWLRAHPALEDGFSKAMAECDSLGDGPCFSYQLAKHVVEQTPDAWEPSICSTCWQQ